MEKQIRTVYAPCEKEKIIEKSRFITYCAHIESEEEAKDFIEEIVMECDWHEEDYPKDPYINNKN